MCVSNIIPRTKNLGHGMVQFQSWVWLLLALCLLNSLNDLVVWKKINSTPAMTSTQSEKYFADFVMGCSLLSQMLCEEA